MPINSVPFQVTPIPFPPPSIYQCSHYTDTLGIYNMQRTLTSHLLVNAARPLVLLCIGTDRSTGDSLGPLTGTKLSVWHPRSLILYGTLASPVHAENLAQTLAEINITYHNPFLVAVDACLGKLSSVGNITLASGPLYPGSAINKNLPPVGDLHLTGVVNVDTFLQYMVLQNTRLNLIWQLSDIFCRLLRVAERQVAQQAEQQESMWPFIKPEGA